MIEAVLVFTFGSLVCNLVGLLALPEGLIESLAESKVCLALGTLNEVLDLPGAGAGGFLGLWGRLSVGWRWGLSVVLLGRWGRGGRCGGRRRLAAAATAHGSGDGRTGNVAHR